MATDTERLILEMSADMRQFEKAMISAAGQADRAAQRIEQRFAKQNAQVTQGFRDFEGNVRNILATLGIAAVVHDVGELSDTWTKVGNKLTSAGVAARDLSAVQNVIADTALRTRSDFEATADLFARMYRVSGDLGANMTRVLAVTELINKALSGASTQERASTVVQLGQALGSGRLQGDELRSILENSRSISEAIAREFNTTVGGIRNIAKTGALEARRVFEAIENAAPQIEGTFARTNATISDSFTNLRTQAVRFVGQNEQTSSSIRTMNALINFTANNFDALADAVVVAASVLGGTFAGIAVAQAVRAMAAFIASMSLAERRALTLRGVLAFFGGPLGIGLAIAGGAMAYLATQTDLFKTSAEAAATAENSLYRALQVITNLQPSHAAGAHTTATATDQVAHAADEAADRLDDMTSSSRDAATQLTVQERATRALAIAEQTRAKATIAGAIADQQAIITTEQRGIALRNFANIMNAIGGEDVEHQRRALGVPSAEAQNRSSQQVIAEAQRQIEFLRQVQAELNSGALVAPTPEGQAGSGHPPTTTPTGGGPTLTELRLQAELTLARARHENQIANEIEDQLEISKRADALHKAGLSVAAARSEAEHSVTLEREAANQEAQRGVEISETQYQIELARARGLNSVAEALQDQLEIRRRIRDLEDAGVSAEEAAARATAQVQAERLAADEQRRSDLAQRSIQNEIAIAQAEHDDRHAEALQRELDLQQRIAELRRMGVDEEKAVDLARQEVAALEQADIQGKFREWFSGAVMASFDGDLDDFLREWWTNLYRRALTDAMNSVADLIYQIFQQAIGGAMGKGGGGFDLGSIFTSIFSGGGGKPGAGDVLKFIPGFASGGRVSRGQPIMVGERGPEPFIPDQNGWIIPNGAAPSVGMSYVDARVINFRGTSEELAQLRQVLAEDLQSRSLQIRAVMEDSVGRRQVFRK